MTVMTNGSARHAAQQEWIDSGGTLTGKQLGKRYGMGERWGRLQIEAARETGTPAPAVVAADKVPVRQRRPTGTAKPKKKGPQPQPRVSWPLLVPMIVADLMVAAVAIVVSYSHIRHLAEVHGMGDLAMWVPLGIDGLVIACTCSVIADRGRQQSLLAWAGLVIGVVASVTFNVMAVGDDPVAQVLAGYSPVALTVSGHLLFRMVGGR